MSTTKEPSAQYAMYCGCMCFVTHLENTELQNYKMNAKL